MEEENNRRETRQRSRSKTPLTLRSSVDRDVGDDKKKSPFKKNPIVEIITEEPPAALATRTATTRPKRIAVAKTITSDYSSDDGSTDSRLNKDTEALIANSVAVVPNAIEQNITKTTTVITTKTVKAGIDQQPLSQSTTKSSVTTRSINREVNQNDSNALFEHNLKLQTSTPREAVISGSGNSSYSDSSISNGLNLEEHPPFKEYKEAGEYWNKYPKTDYTYSKLSPHRRELTAGFVAMPNMSRRSLEHHNERVNIIAKTDPVRASFLRSRYESFTTRNRPNRAADNYYDSQDEIDLSNGKRYYYSTASSQSWIRRLIPIISTLISSSYYRVTDVFRPSKKQDLYYSRLGEQKRGIIRRTGSSIANGIWAVARSIYIFIASVLLLDSWLLRSKSASNSKKKGFLLLSLILLPLLLLSAWLLADEVDRHYYLSRLPKNLPDLSQVPSIQELRTVLSEYASRTSTIIPLTLAVVKPYVKNFNDKIRYVYDVNWNWIAIPWSHSSESQIKNNLKIALTEEEYNNVLNHINVYIDTVINQKLAKQELHSHEKILPHIALHIAKEVKSHVTQFKYDLTDADIELLVDNIRRRLAEDGLLKARKSEPFQLNQDNLELISKIVKEHIELHRNDVHIYGQREESKTVEISEAQIDIDEILFKILTSSKLQDFVDQRISAKISLIPKRIDEHQVSIDELQSELDNLKNKLTGTTTENHEIHISLAQMQNDQNELNERLTKQQNDNIERFEKLLNDIDIKLSTLNEKQTAAIDEHVRLVLLDIIGYKGADGRTLENIDITNWIRNVFVAKDLLEERLNALNEKFDNKLHEEINRSSALLMKDISEKIRRDVVVLIEKNKEKVIIESADRSNIALDEARIKAIVKEALAVYDADKTGMVDYALESSGGEVLSTRCTENFKVKTAQLSIFGIPLWYKSNTPRTVISPSVQPGECWAFQGFPGYLVLKLNHNVFVTGFTLEHIPKSLSPNGHIDSAPKLFTVWGLESENDQEPVLFGEYEYAENGTSLQYFPVKKASSMNRSHSLVEVRVESNHGNISYTCLYRFRVHGSLSPVFT